VRRCVPRAWLSGLMIQAAVIGLVGGGLTMGVLTELRGASSLLIGFLGGVTGLTLALLWFQAQMLRVRSSIRRTIKDALGDERTPVCLDCGYDLRAVQADRCPECGAPTRRRRSP